ncbi:hypothetical protein AB0J25_01150 [Streptomyces sp. NPDC049910]|uniref:hypothetical protein n=1 Tax=Streptomyces sp. NPDC049910 TaxID=3155278 RepID=UPI0034445478
MAVVKATSNYYLKFDKSQKNPTDSRLYLMKKRGKGKSDQSVTSWRAGSGNGSKNECKSNAGWLPNGTHKIEFRSTSYNDSAIKGYVIKLQDKWSAVPTCPTCTPSPEVWNETAKP